ncbi:MAG TPA: hypothetical protein VH088_08940 [Terriglobales bacterium]|nr:hypothetical protein [Terriglobales bacterium]
MARGWESKGIEEQQAEARDVRSDSNRKTLTPEEITKKQTIDALRLSRSRIVQQLETAQNPAYRKTLEAALADLNQKLSSQNDSQV